MPIVDAANLHTITRGKQSVRLLLCSQNPADPRCGAALTAILYKETRRLNNSTSLLARNALLDYALRTTEREDLS